MDIVHPSMKELLQKVDSRYTLVVLGAKRARQLLDHAELRVVPESTKDVSNALYEIAAGKVTYERTKAGIK